MIGKPVWAIQDGYTWWPGFEMVFEGFGNVHLPVWSEPAAWEKHRPYAFARIRGMAS